MVPICIGMLQGHREATRSPKGVSESIALCLDFCSGFGGAKLCTLPVHFRGPLGAPLGPHPAPFLLDGWGEPKHASHILQKRWPATDLPGASQRSESCSKVVCTPTCGFSKWAHSYHCRPRREILRSLARLMEVLCFRPGNGIHIFKA